MDNKQISVSVAFDMLLEAFTREIALARRDTKASIEANYLERARTQLENLAALTAFHDDLLALAKKWRSLHAPTARRPRRLPAPLQPNMRQARPHRKISMRRRSNIPQPRYYLAILRALAAMGGSGDVDDVLRRVERELRPSFGPEELAPVNSSPNEPSWRNTARWARADMVTGGLLRRDSPHGTWEISDAGRLYLQRNSANPSDQSADQPRPATEAFSRETPHTLNEDFSYKRPSAFVLQGRRYNYVSSWRHLYELVCQQLYSKDPALFASLLDHPGLKGKKLFTTDPQSLLAPVQVGGGLYAEGNKSARDIAQQIRRLLAIFRIPEDQMVIYLSPGD